MMIQYATHINVKNRLLAQLLVDMIWILAAGVVKKTIVKTVS